MADPGCVQSCYAKFENPGKRDWSVQVLKDLSDIGLGDLSFSDIKSQSKDSFKKLVKEKWAGLAFKTLLKEKDDKTKIKNLKYDKLEIQEYLTTDKINIAQKKLVYKIKTRMIDTPDSYGREPMM